MTILMRLRNLTWRVKEANTRVRESHERQRAIVHAQNRKQRQVEQDGIRLIYTTWRPTCGKSSWPLDWSTSKTRSKKKTRHEESQPRDAHRRHAQQVEDDWEAEEDRIQNVQERQAEVQAVAREGRGNVVELGHVAEALNAHTRRVDMMAEHHRQMYETDRQQREARADAPGRS